MREKGYGVDVNGFEKEMQTQVERCGADRQAKAAAALGRRRLSWARPRPLALISFWCSQTTQSAVADAVKDDAVSGSGVVQALFIVDENGASAE